VNCQKETVTLKMSVNFARFFKEGVRFSLLADLALPHVRFVPDADVRQNNHLLLKMLYS